MRGLRGVRGGAQAGTDTGRHAASTGTGRQPAARLGSKGREGAAALAIPLQGAMVPSKLRPAPGQARLVRAAVAAAAPARLPAPGTPCLVAAGTQPLVLVAPVAYEKSLCAKSPARSAGHSPS